MPALDGVCIALGAWYMYHNIIDITNGTGWPVILNFILAVIEFILIVILLYELGVIASSAKSWIKYLKNKQEEITDTIDDDSPDCDASDETTNE